MTQFQKLLAGSERTNTATLNCAHCGKACPTFARMVLVKGRGRGYLRYCDSDCKRAAHPNLTEAVR